MKSFKESALKVRQQDIKPMTKIMANQYVEKGNFKRIMDLLKHMGKKVKLDVPKEKSSKVVWTVEDTMQETSKKPVSQMTPAEKKKDAERRKEYNAYQKSKRNEGKGPGKLGPNASREDKINHTMKIMKMYPANKGKSEKELRKGATDYIDQVKIKYKKIDDYIAKMKAKKESVEEAKEPSLKSSDYAKGTYQSAQAFKDKFAKKKKEKKESVEVQEKTKWKMGDGRPRNGARIENDRFWNLPYDSLKYIAKDAGEAMKANPTARKATTGPGNWADQVADAATVMQWRKKNGIKESVELDEQKMDQKMFDSLKKGDKLSVSFGSGIRKDNNVTLQVKSKSKSAKYNLEKINCFNVQNPGGMKYTIYNRQGKFSLAQGDMGTHGADFVKESVELDEAIDYFKVSKELSDYAKKHGGPDKVEFQKAAAYVREIGKNSAVSVQDKAGKGLNMLFKNADTDVRDRLQMILTKGGFKVKGGYVMRESVEEATFMVTVPKGGPAGKDLNMKVSGKDKMDAVKQWRKKYPKFKNDTINVESVDEASIIKTVHKNVTNKKSVEKDRKKAVKTYQDIRKGKYPGVKMANEDDDPCWDSHKMVGMKKKGNKMVPNCVPK